MVLHFIVFSLKTTLTVLSGTEKTDQLSAKYRNRIAGFVYEMAHDPVQVRDEYRSTSTFSASIV